MTFNSVVYALFLPLVFALYWALHPHRRGQNLLLLAASYVFYGWWDWRFLMLLAGTSVLDWALALGMDGAGEQRRRRLLWLSLASNLGVLGLFKYFNFFVASGAEALAALGLGASAPTLAIVLPVGISFYTFQSLSYTIDAYRGHLKPTRDPLEFLAFVSFFPQLVAGPIERATDLLPQFQRGRRFDDAQARDGLREILWGLAKKVVVADNLAPVVDQVFRGQAAAGGPMLAAGALMFALQIYCDFSGYSHIARGSARLFGFELMRNFRHPYFAVDVADFWRRWHVSLSTWFRDYLYLPLGGSRGGRARHLRNVMATFVISGLWHGANWTYVGWGLLHGLYYVPLVLRGRVSARAAPGAEEAVPTWRDLPAIAWTFLLTTLAWVFFRAASLRDAAAYLAALARPSAWAGAELLPGTGGLLLLCLAVLVVEWLQRARRHALDLVGWPRPARWAVYYGVCLAVFAFGNLDRVAFIYFQF